MDFAILGPLELRRNGRPVELPGTRQRCLLAVLLLHAGEVVSSDRLLDAVWGESPPAAGTTALRVRVSQLRKALGRDGELVVTRPPGYVLRAEPAAIDLHRFERLVHDGDRSLERGDAAGAARALEAGLALWRGPALADLAYEPYLQGPIMRLDELRLAAREQLVAARLALGEHGWLVGELQQLVADHPLRERLWAQLMLALYRDGRQAEALDAYRAARRALVEEVGIEPGPDLRELERRILAQDESLRAGTAPARRPRTVVATPVASDAFAGLAALGSALARDARAELLVVALVADADALADATERLAALPGDMVRVAAFTSEDPAADTARLAAEHDVALLLVDADPEPPDGRRLDPVLTGVLREVAPDVALVVGAGREAGSGPVVVPFAGSDHDWAAVEAGAWLARATGAGLRLIGTEASPRKDRRDASRLLASASLALQRGVGVASETVLAAPGAEGVLEAARGAAAVVVGLSDRWRREGLGATRFTVARDAACPVLLVRRGTSPGGLAPAEALTRFTWSAIRA